MSASSKVWLDGLKGARETLDRFLADPKLLEACVRFEDLLVATYERGGTAFVCGNGGSHCDAMHFAEELTGRYRKERRPLGALALGDAAHVTCVSNDYGFEQVFARQLEGLAREGDLFIALSTSGNSANVIRALEVAKAKKLATVALLGRDGGKLKGQVDVPIVVPAETSDRIQEVHIKLIHTVIEACERRMFPENY
jgi:D-sedoheptulose 7-phosphate isomerase